MKNLKVVIALNILGLFSSVYAGDSEQYQIELIPELKDALKTIQLEVAQQMVNKDNVLAENKLFLDTIKEDLDSYQEPETIDFRFVDNGKDSSAE